jgi:hypothetical protein
VVKETILNYTENRSSCKIASLDAEKAFDRVWRDGLFYKLYKKIHPSYWYILKKYYDSSQGIIRDTINIGHEFQITCMSNKEESSLRTYLIFSLTIS